MKSIFIYFTKIGASGKDFILILKKNKSHFKIRKECEIFKEVAI